MRDMYDHIKNIVLDIITHPFKTVITFLFMVMFLIIINSCATTHEPFHFVKVLGVTHAGDTVLIDVNSLRPRVYNTYQYRNSVPYYNYIPLTPQFIIRPTRPVIIPTPPVVIPTPIKPIPITKPIVLKKGK